MSSAKTELEYVVFFYNVFSIILVATAHCFSKKLFRKSSFDSFTEKGLCRRLFVVEFYENFVEHLLFCLETAFVILTEFGNARAIVCKSLYSVRI